MLNTQKVGFWTLAAAIVFAVLSCGGAGDGAPPARHTASGNGLTLDIQSPAENQLYTQPDPKLVYSVADSDSGESVPDDRLEVSVHDVVDDTRTRSVILENAATGSNLPHLDDGLHELEFTVNDDTGEPLLTASIRFATTTVPVADAGMDQSARPGDTVVLSGNESYSRTGQSIAYAWNIDLSPEGSTAALSSPTVVNPSFITDLPGDYTIWLVVSESGAAGEPDFVTISTFNAAPVADAGADLSMAVIGDTVTLDASFSFDEDGDSLTYSWGFVSKPEGSQAQLSDPTLPDPTFQVDVVGTYQLVLVVSDEYGEASEPVTVKVTFDNLAPVALAGTAETSVPIGERVYLDGSGSWDPNGDSLTYRWSIASLPQGSTAVVGADVGDETSFVPDLPGTYVISLAVNDGLLNGTPYNVTFVAVVNEDSTAIQILMEALAVIADLEDGDFKNPDNRKALTNKILAVIEDLDEGDVEDAAAKLRSDVADKTNGCADGGANDKNDWLVNCAAQDMLYPVLQDVLTVLAP